MGILIGGFVVSGGSGSLISSVVVWWSGSGGIGGVVPLVWLMLVRGFVGRWRR